MSPRPDHVERPARGGTLLALWMISLLMAVCSVFFGWWQWLLMWMTTDGMRSLAPGKRDPAGHRLTRSGRRFAIVGIITFAALLAMILFSLSKPH